MRHDIVMLGMNKYRDWQHTKSYNRSYYVLQQLLGRNEVGKILFVDYLPIRRQEALVDYFSIIGRMFCKPVQVSPLSVLNTLRNDKLYVYASVASVINWKIFYDDLARVLKKLNFNNEIIWSYDPLNVDFFDLLDNKITVFDIDSDWRSRKNLQNGKDVDYLGVIRKNYNRMAEKADFIFTSSDELMEVFMGHKNSHWVTDLRHKEFADFDWKKVSDEMFSYINQKNTK